MMPLTFSRRPTRLIAPVVVALLLLAGPAGADVPEGWSNPPEVSLVDMLMFTLFVPAGLFVLIAVLAWMPALAKGRKQQTERGLEATTSK